VKKGAIGAEVELESFIIIALTEVVKHFSFVQTAVYTNMKRQDTEQHKVGIVISFFLVGK